MNEYRSEARVVLREGFWTGTKIIWLVFLLIFLASGLGFAYRLLSRPAALVDRVTDPDRIISNYEWFEEAYNDCLALDAKIATTVKQIDSQFQGLPADRSEWSRQDRDAYAQWNTTLNGQRSQRQNIVAEYNAKSRMITRQLWKASHLPYQLEIVDEQTKGVE
jgi:hypothetical protein